ncbi:hypothetical protein HPB49_004894 [Dermacentor silvarum]|uniref:Uncharacterized protein n=1 Tax=Dermacentor silvarum TaxID=543639 RepID=A0ACB8C266_DERSI|nr:hypothetical protein HPB49_004894 [Dermacentor silvarum]
MTSKCLVTYGDKNVVVNFDEPWTDRQLIENLKEREMFAEVDISTLGLMCFDEDFQVHVDISEEDAIENKSKIKIKETGQVRYPGRLYTEAARVLVIRFPNLADATVTGYATAMVEAEDGETVACHISAMAKEVLKARPDMAYIEDCMARTLASRREWVAKENPSVDEMLLKYPVLSISFIDPAKVHYVPTVTFTGGILTTQEFTVCLEGIAIKEGSLLAAIATQMALYWTCTIVFNKKAQKTFDLLCHLLKIHSGLRTTPLVRVAQTLLSQ